MDRKLNTTNFIESIVSCINVKKPLLIEHRYFECYKAMVQKVVGNNGSNHRDHCIATASVAAAVAAAKEEDENKHFFHF